MTTCEAEKRALNAGNGGHTCMVRSLVSSSIYAKNDMMFIGAMVPKGLTWSLCRTRVHCKKWLNILSPELQLWQWCNVSSPLWQPSMGSVGNATLVEYSNNWILPSVQRSLPLYKLIGHFNHTACGYPTFTLVSETDRIRHLPGSWSRFPHWQSWEHQQGHYNWVSMEIFMPWWQHVTPSQMFSG